MRHSLDVILESINSKKSRSHREAPGDMEWTNQD